MKQTGLEFILEQITLFDEENEGVYFTPYLKKEILEKAKEMDKHQMIAFAKYCEHVDVNKSDMESVLNFYLNLDDTEELLDETSESK